MYGRQITTLPHPHEEDPEDPDYEISESQVRKRLTNQARLLEHFQARWRREYLTALREFHKVSGRSSQSVKVGDIVLIHDDRLRLHWRLAIVDGEMMVWFKQ